MPDLTPTEARERLENRADREILNHSLAGVHSVTADAAEKVLDAILATTDALAVLVTWPALLAAGKRAGKLTSHIDWVTIKIVPLFPQMNEEREVENWRLTDPRGRVVSVAWRWAKCYCNNGLIGGADGYPRTCPSCGGNGGVYVTAKGARALYPGGPFLGSDTDHHEWDRGVPVLTDPEAAQ